MLFLISENQYYHILYLKSCFDVNEMHTTWNRRSIIQEWNIAVNPFRVMWLGKSLKAERSRQFLPRTDIYFLQFREKEAPRNFLSLHVLYTHGRSVLRLVQLCMQVTILDVCVHTMLISWWNLIYETFRVFQYPW